MRTKLTPVCPIADYSPRRGTQGKILACWLTVLALALTLATGQAQTFTVLKSFGFLTNVTGNHPQSTLVQGPDGTLYGTTFKGDGSVAGTVFKVQPDGSGFAVLKWFTNYLEGVNPYAGLALSGSVLYGTTTYGGNPGVGTVFKVNTDGSGYTVLRNFTNSPDGFNPGARLTLSGSTLYGTTVYGGSSGVGTVFKVNTDGTGYMVLKHFLGSDGANPYAGLALSSSVLYGATDAGGSSGVGTVFKVNTDGTGYTVLKNFTNSPDGAYPYGDLALSGSVLYGTTYGGGNPGDGTVFKLNTNGTGYTVLKHFTGSDGADPSGSLTLSGSVLYGTTYLGGSSYNGTVFKVNTDGTGYTVLKDFPGGLPHAGFQPYAGPILSGSVLYGTTAFGGSSGVGGTVFKVNTDGTGYTELKNFTQVTGINGPQAGLTLSGTTLYGTTYGDGSSDNGTVLRVNTDGTGYAVLKSFTNSSDGANPAAGLTLSGSALYGTTLHGGSSNYGTVFQVNTDGTGYIVLKNFTSSDGAGPYGDLTLADSTLYGTTSSGGSSNYGTVFKLNTDGTGYTVLKNFTGSDGAGPYAALTLSGSTLYGTTAYGTMALTGGTVFKINTDGTGFAVLRSFTNSSEGASPEAGLTLSGGTLYGTTFGGGSFDRGTVFKVNTDGTGYTVLKKFTGSDGAGPLAVLTLSGSTLYGTTANGGSSDNGTVFRVNTDGTGYGVKSFSGSDGAYPFAGVTLSGSVLYGTTSSGGAFGDGEVFSLSFPPPQLTIVPSGPNVILTWPANVAGFDYSGYTLQSTTNLISPAVWTTNSPAPVVVNGQNTVTNPISGPQMFYRLIQ